MKMWIAQIPIPNSSQRSSDEPYVNPANQKDPEKKTQNRCYSQKIKANQIKQIGSKWNCHWIKGTCLLVWQTSPDDERSRTNKRRNVHGLLQRITKSPWTWASESWDTFTQLPINLNAATTTNCNKSNWITVSFLSHEKSNFTCKQQSLISDQLGDMQNRTSFPYQYPTDGKNLLGIVKFTLEQN